jgi:hypothetical protein
LHEPQRRGQWEYGNHIPKAMMHNVVTVSGQLARLWRNGILLVRITWIMSVWVSSLRIGVSFIGGRHPARPL